MLRLTMILLALAPVVAWANPCYQIGDGPKRLACYDRMAECLGIEGANARLACLDARIRNKAAKDGGAPDTASSAPPAMEEKAVPEAPAAEDTFGMAPKEPGQETSTITHVETRQLDGVDFITLANHQVWRETLDQTNRFRVGQTVTIKPAFFGSYSLFCDDIGKLIKVHRVK